ncbi:MAG TPA: roadblock/LC7 domain-containing protein [Longimicrobiaceae bacterium]|nr:roadblock/LC7 domain-containing protein [Longimicrobiaceae bacterium]
MSELDAALDAMRAHPGVEHVLVLGRDGLLIQHAGDGALDPETVSAMVPGLTAAAGALGRAADAGDAETVVVKLERGVALAAVLGDDVLLAVLLRDGVGFAPLLRELGSRRAALASLV